MPLDVISEDLTEDEVALLWGAAQTTLYANATADPSLAVLDDLNRLDALARRLWGEMSGRWGRVSMRRPVDHTYRATLGQPTRCAVITPASQACGLPPDQHANSGGLPDAISANEIARREGATRTTSEQPSRAPRSRRARQ